MFSFPGITVLVLLIFVRPQEVYPVLQEFPVYYVFFALAVFGLILDLRLRVTRPQFTPQILWVGLFFVWCVISAMTRSNDSIAMLRELAILFVWYYLLSHGIQSFRALHATCVVLLGLTLILSLIGIHQQHQPLQCLKVREGVMLTVASGVPDGRSCETRSQCYVGAPDPRAEYICERVGVMETSTIGGRVRYRGILQDPNELSLTLAVSLPFALAFVQLRRSRKRLFAAGLLSLLALLCVLYTQSRTGYMVVLAVIAVYVLAWTGVRGAILGGLASIPFLAVVASGSGRADASASTKERLECWYEGMTMFKDNPFTGVGFDQFTEHHFLTAHNSYILAPAELGFVGMLLWVAVLYMSIKIAWVAVLRYRGEDENSKLARRWGLALLAALIGLAVGSFFLSFCYHYMFWCYIGLAGAYYQAVRSHDSEFRVTFGVADALILVVLVSGMVVGLYGFTRAFPPT